MTAKLTSIEQHAQAAQQAHDARFADLHKDLASIVWEVSKLRAELTRVQQQQQQQVRVGGAVRGGVRAAAGYDSAYAPRTAMPAGVSPGAPGARSWRGGAANPS